MRADRRHDAMGIVFVSGDGQLNSKLAGLEAGAADYLVKPVAVRELLARVDAHVRERSSLQQRLQARFDTRAQLAHRIIELGHTLDIDELEGHLAAIMSDAFPVLSLTLAASPTTGFAIARHNDGVRIQVPLPRRGRAIGSLDVVMPIGEVEQATATLTDLAPQIAAVAAAALTRAADTHAVRDWIAGLSDPGALQSVCSSPS